MPCNYRDYGPDWKWIRRQILDQAEHACEFCGVANYSMRGSTRIVLTIAHLNHDLRDNDPSGLRALCQRCHLAWDQEHHQRNAANTRRLKQAHAGQMELVS